MSIVRLDTFSFEGYQSPNWTNSDLTSEIF